MFEDKIQVREVKLSNVLSDLGRGRIRVPRFQRDYVWNYPKVIELLNSIHKQYPVGSFFLWEASAEYSHLYRNIPELKVPEPRSTDVFEFILDGQQRLTSLYVAFTGLKLSIETVQGNTREINYGDISFDLDRETFIYHPADNERYVSVRDLVESNLAVYDELEQGRKRRFDRCRRIFDTYPLSVVYVSDQTLVEAAEIFERINQGGMRLKLFDLVVASTWTPAFDLKEKATVLNKELESAGFGPIEPDILLQTISLYVTGQASKKAQLSLTADLIVKSWPKINEATRRAVEYLRANLGVRANSFLPFTTMLPMVVYLFAKSKKASLTKLEKEFLDEWFWKAAFSERYIVSPQSRMGEDRRTLFDTVLEGRGVNIPYRITLVKEDLISASIARRTSLRNAVQCLLAMQRPLHLLNNAQAEINIKTISWGNTASRHHVFPQNYLGQLGQSAKQHSLMNFIFLTTELNSSIRDAAPSKYLSKLEKLNPQLSKALRSHLLPVDGDSALRRDDFLEFLDERATIVFSEIQKLVGQISAIRDQLNEAPNAVVDFVEERIRSLFDEEFRLLFGDDYWNEAIPDHIRTEADRRLKQSKSRNPGEVYDAPFEKLAFLNVTDYVTVAVKHWRVFEDDFHSKHEFELNMKYFSELRNAIKHNRKLSPVEQKYGEAATEWLLSALSRDDDRFKAASYSNYKPKDSEVMICKGNGFTARGVSVSDGFLVLAESEANGKMAPSSSEYVTRIREPLLADGTLQPAGSNFVFTRNHLFGSPSAASVAVLGRSSNGWIVWKNAEGKTLTDLAKDNG